MITLDPTQPFDARGRAKLVERTEGGLWRGTLAPGDDLSDFPEEVQAQIAAVWTQEVREAYATEQAVMDAANDRPRSGPVIVPYGVFEARWSDTEFAALFAAERADWRVRRFVNLATAQGHVNLTGVDDPESGSPARAAKALFVALGVLTEERAAVIFEPS